MSVHLLLYASHPFPPGTLSLLPAMVTPAEPYLQYAGVDRTGPGWVTRGRTAERGQSILDEWTWFLSLVGVRVS